MEKSYENMVVLVDDADAVVAALGGHKAFVAPAIDGAVAVFFDFDVSVPGVQAQNVSTALDCDLIWFAVQDDGLLGCQFWRSGDLVAEVTAPDIAAFFGLDPAIMAMIDSRAEEAGLKAADEQGPEEFLTAVDRGDGERALAALKDDYESAISRHHDVLAALDLPTFVAGWNYKDLAAGRRDAFEGPELIAVNVDS